ncbi:uncharacterized protein UV8b_05576 [Ustilaginoidea virens]|uniref:Uncharacterized protein n=1 Tax=Ustilaginoidea virens TaxID=1159556 RepID=A0A8E5MI87_USTVR|nr:uncharacterized protein UV8b_05576 [Ustilaginoidea virens]QUC21333.1 hypothetical protein UV8b_05576 [Ustilaginoidea virens]
MLAAAHVRDSTDGCESTSGHHLLTTAAGAERATTTIRANHQANPMDRQHPPSLPPKKRCSTPPHPPGAADAAQPTDPTRLSKRAAITATNRRLNTALSVCHCQTRCWLPVAAASDSFVQRQKARHSSK